MSAWARACLRGCLPHLIDILGGVGKVQDAHGVGAMMIDEARPSLGSIHHRTYGPGALDTAPMPFHHSLLAKGLGIGQTRKGRDLSGADFPVSIPPYLGHDQRFDFRLLTSQQRYSGEPELLNVCYLATVSRL